MISAKQFLKRRPVPAAADEDADGGVEELQPGSKTLRLGVVHPGSYVAWTSIDSAGQEPLWVVEDCPSRMQLRDAHSDDIDGELEGEDGEEEEDGDEFGPLSSGASKMSGRSFDSQRPGAEESDDDPNQFILKMKKEMDVQRQMLRLLMMAHKKAREEWAHNPFKMTGQEGRGEAEVLKLLFLVADQPIEDERISAEHVDELKAQTPYGEFPTISKCGKTFGDASAISMACATKFQLFGETVQEQLVVGAIYGRLRRIQENHRRALAWVFCGQVKDKAKIEWAQGQLLHVILPPAIKEWDAQIRSTKGPFVVESGMTLADLAIMDFLDQCSGHVMIEGLLADHLAVSDMMEAVRSCPKLLAHLQDREEE